MTDPDRVIHIRRPYLDLIAGGAKTVEVRVGYPSMRRIRAGHVLAFESGDARCRARVVKVAEYESFEAMLDTEDHRAIGGEGRSRSELLAACREIYPPEKEALGVLAIHLRLAP
ncbi:ASCH domain-containing protein [Kitasatospora sp. NPDC090091]|uniref:ASCH domain-containing protein n=1 Tax=Kitasatospora sp. NPDC090091 TaxID=3364081 RepID=UPI0037F93BCB